MHGGKARGARRAYTVPSGIDPSIITQHVECICDSEFCTLPHRRPAGHRAVRLSPRGHIQSDITYTYEQWSELAMIPTLPCAMEVPIAALS